MFTGLVEEKGIIKEIKTNSLTIDAKKVLEKLRVGDSISVNGVCLTVKGMSGTSFQVDVLPKTLHLTNLGRLKEGDLVNLERAMVVGERVGGHFLTGHIDGVGKVTKIKKEEAGWSVRFAVPRDLIRYMVLRGSVGVDGVSLTVGELFEDGFTVFIIPHTFYETTIGGMHIGYLANIEVDMIAKYIERLLYPKREAITMEFLREHGFL